jgi:hypothetical protein
MLDASFLYGMGLEDQEKGGLLDMGNGLKKRLRLRDIFQSARERNLRRLARNGVPGVYTPRQLDSLESIGMSPQNPAFMENLGAIALNIFKNSSGDDEANQLR